MSIILKGLSKWYEDVLVVNRLSLQVQDGELFVLLGASGSGKSTVLRMIAGLTHPQSGTIQLNGKDVTELPPQSRGVGFVFQNYSIFRHMNVAENVEFGLKVRKVPARQRARRSEELLDLVGLGGLGKRFAHQLSGGQQQRVAIARALAYEPSVLLLDEPFGALDVKIRGQLRANLREIQQRLKLTTILVTHDQEEAFELADRIGVMERGNLVETGTPQGLYHRPRTEFAANFIGGKNLLIGRVDGGVIKLGDTVLPVPPEMSAHRTRVRILFRPETVLLKPEPFQATEGVVVLGQGKVVERLFVGPFQRIRLEVERPEGIRPLAQEFGERRTMQIEAVRPSELEPGVSYEPGQTFWTGFKQYHLLDTFWPKLLLCQHDAGVPGAVPAVGSFLAQKARSHAMLLSVTDDAENVPRLRDRLEAIRQSYAEQTPHLQTRVRQGSRDEEILLEAQEGHYEMVVLGRKEKPLRETTVRMILQRLGIPVLVVQEQIKTLSRFLICSAMGEPGKVDVRIGGRLARLVGAEATVLHVSRGGENGYERKRTELHLEQALSTLETFAVKADSKIGAEPAVDYILKEANSGNYDLIVIGASHSSTRIPWQDAASQIVSGTILPVLIVPMKEFA